MAIDIASFSAVDWATIVHADSAIHILHGGAADPAGVYNCVRHLQWTWGAAVVMVQGPQHLQELADTIADRVPKNLRLLLCVPSHVVAARPSCYDMLCRCRRGFVTVVVTVPIRCLGGPPYGTDVHLVAVVLASCRVDLDCVGAVCDVYSFPGGAAVLTSALWVQPHVLGLAWEAAVSAAPAFVSFADPVAEMTTRAVRNGQDVVDRAWYWNGAATLAPCMSALPPRPRALVCVQGAPFAMALPDVGLHRMDDDSLSFISVHTRAELNELRSTPAVADAWYDAHVVGDDDVVVGVRLSLAGTDETVLPDSGQVRLSVRCAFPPPAGGVPPDTLGGSVPCWRTQQPPARPRVAGRK